MAELPSLRFIRERVRNKNYRLTKHAMTVRLERGITTAGLEQALLTGEIIERYPDAQPYPACLVLGYLTSAIRCTLSVREATWNRLCVL